MRILIAIILSLLLFSCSNIVYNDDAVNIDYEKYKEDRIKDTTEVQFDPLITPNTGEYRNPSTLRGNVYHILEIESRNEETDKKKSEKYVVFLDSANFNNDEFVEFIPLEYVILPKPPTDSSSFWVAEYNSPDLHRSIRELDYKFMKASSCTCKDPRFPSVNLQAGLACPFKWEERLEGRSRIFAELNLGVSIYDNFNPDFRRALGEENFSGELVAGYRFGDYTEEHFGLGLSYFYGVNQYSRFSGENIRRDALMLHGKYTFDIFHEYACIFPYIYGQFGMAVDINSLYVGRLGFAQDIGGAFGMECECEFDGEADFEYRNEMVLRSPDADFDIPLSFGLGAGVEMSLNKYLDLSIDLNYKYVQYGERQVLFNLQAPKIEDMSVLSLRIGLHY